MNKKVLAGIVGVSLVVLIGFIIVVNYTYSDGIRQGVVTKISYKGHLCKTWEGQLAQANFWTSDNHDPNVDTDNTFYFSVDKKAVAEQIKQAMLSSSTVNLEYQQKLFPLALPIPGLCQRRTDYEVQEISVLAGTAGQPQGSMPMKP